MSDQTAIEWTERTLNMWTGCRKVSPGCARCYIPRTMPFRKAGRRFEHGDIPLVFHMDRLERMVRRQRPSLYFVNSLSDVFHEDAPDDAVAQLFGAMAAASQHTFQILTKRPERMRALLDQPPASRFWTSVWTHGARYADADADRAAPARLVDNRFVLTNVWLGVSIENRRFVDRADVLRATPAEVRFISAEPLLGPLVGWPGKYGRVSRLCVRCDRRFLPQHSHLYRSEGWVCDNCVKPDEGTPANDRQRSDGLDLTGIDWLIVGGESGSGARPMQLEWARDLRDATRCRRCRGIGWLCAATGRPADGKCCGTSSCPSSDGCPECQGECGGRGYTTAFFFKQWGGLTAKSGGRELDGRTWDEMPREMTVRPARV